MLLGEMIRIRRLFGHKLQSRMSIVKEFTEKQDEGKAALTFIHDSKSWYLLGHYLFLFNIVLDIFYTVSRMMADTVVIRDMRLLHPEDIQNKAAYPIVSFQLNLHVQKCEVCRIYRATKMTINDKWAPENPCYFCDNCYFLLHYTQDGSLQYEDLEVHDYHHDQPR